VKKARPEGILQGFSCGKKLNTQSKKLLTSNNLNKESKMYKHLYFVKCEDCLIEYNSEDVNILKITHTAIGDKIAEFVCTLCQKTTESLITEV